MNKNPILIKLQIYFYFFRIHMVGQSVLTFFCLFEVLNVFIYKKVLDKNVKVKLLEIEGIIFFSDSYELLFSLEFSFLCLMLYLAAGCKITGNTKYFWNSQKPRFFYRTVSVARSLKSIIQQKKLLSAFMIKKHAGF